MAQLAPQQTLLPQAVHGPRAELQRLPHHMLSVSPSPAPQNFVSPWYGLHVLLVCAV